jgi:hypothetical protein
MMRIAMVLLCLAASLGCSSANGTATPERSRPEPPVSQRLQPASSECDRACARLLECVQTPWSDAPHCVEACRGAAGPEHSMFECAASAADCAAARTCWSNE